MIAVDTNVLVRAHRRELPLHEQALARLRQLVEGGLPWALPVFCVAEFVRVVTHPKVFDPPSTLGEALGALEGLLASANLQILSPGPRHPAVLLRLLREGDARGNLAFDAQIAAVCLEHGALDLLTLDRDFDRFKDLRTAAL